MIYSSTLHRVEREEVMRAEREGFDLQWPGSDNEDNEEINQQILPQECMPASVPIQTAQQAYPPPVQHTPPQTHESGVTPSTNGNGSGSGNGNTSYHTTSSHTVYQNSSPNSSPRELTPQLHKRSQMIKANSLSDYNLYNGIYCFLFLINCSAKDNLFSIRVQ